MSVTDVNLKAETFLHYFQSIYTDHESCLLESVKESEINTTTNYLSNIQISTNEVEEMLIHLIAPRLLALITFLLLF